MAEAERQFDSKMRANPQMHKHKGTLATFLESKDFVHLAGKVDLIYIDGLHTYDGCKSDLQLAKSIVNPRLAYSGHDYH